MNKINILEEGMKETVAYIKSLSTAFHFERIVERYIVLHNKGIFVDFNYNSLNAIQLFEVLLKRYGADRSYMNIINPTFSRASVVRTREIEKRLEHKKADVERRHRKFYELKQLKRQIEDQLNPTLTKEFLNTQEGVDYIFSTEQANYEKELDRLKRQLDFLKRKDKNRRSATSATASYEQMVFRVVLSFYMKRLEAYLKDIFQTEQLSVVYDEKEWLKSFNQTPYSYATEKGMTPFEQRMQNVISQNAQLFSIKLFTPEQIYTLSKSGIYSTNVNRADTQNKENPLADVESRLLSLYQNNQHFFLLMKLMGAWSESGYEESQETRSLKQLIFQNVSSEVINEYNRLLEEVRKVRNKPKKTFENRTKSTPKINEVFPQVHFEIGQIQDLGYKFALGEERYVTVLLSVSNGDFILPLNKVGENRVEIADSVEMP